MTRPSIGLLTVVLAASLPTAGCGSPSGSDDAGPASDSAVAVDAGVSPDAGALDAGSDAGTSPDAGALDDAGSDAGPADGDAGPTDAGPDCGYLDAVWIVSCAGGPAYLRHWTSGSGPVDACPEYFTLGTERFDSLDNALSSRTCDTECLRGPSTSVSVLRCGVRTGFIVYADTGDDCPSLLETSDGLFESQADWDEAHPCE